jgi:N-acetylmuramoyl-L-alanine amidase
MKIAVSPSEQSWNAYAGGSNEKIEMDDLGHELAQMLGAAGHDVLLCTGNSWQENVAQSNNFGAELHIELHSNAGGGRGTEIWYRTGSEGGRKLAQAIYNHLALATAAPDRGVKNSLAYGALNQTHCTAVIIETEFHDYYLGAEEIRTHHKEYAIEINDGILEIAGRPVRPQLDSVPASKPVSHPYPGNPREQGMKDAHVGLIQRRLRDHGYVVTVDNDFGPLTKRAVVAFQKAHHPLAEDGVVGPQTWAVLFT